MADESTREQMVIIICERGATDEVLAHLRQADVHYFTLHHGFLGTGETGRHESTAVWPGTNSVIFCVLPEWQVPEVTKTLREVHDSRPGHSVGLKVFALPVQELL